MFLHDLCIIIVLLYIYIVLKNVNIVIRFDSKYNYVLNYKILVNYINSLAYINIANKFIKK